MMRTTIADEVGPKNKATADEVDPRTHVHHSERHSRVPTPDAGITDPCLAGRCICQFCQSGGFTDYDITA